MLRLAAAGALQQRVDVGRLELRLAPEGARPEEGGGSEERYCILFVGVTGAWPCVSSGPHPEPGRLPESVWWGGAFPPSSLLPWGPPPPPLAPRRAGAREGT